MLTPRIPQRAHLALVVSLHLLLIKPLFGLSNNNTNNSNSSSSSSFNPLKNAVRPSTPTDPSSLSGKPPASPKKLFVPVLENSTKFSLKEEIPTPENKKPTKFDVNKLKQSFSLDAQFVSDLDDGLSLPKSNKIEELSDDSEEDEDDDSDSSDEEKVQDDNEEEDEDDEETTDEEEEENDEESELEDEEEEETFVPEQTPSSVPPPTVISNPSVEKSADKGSTLATEEATVEEPVEESVEEPAMKPAESDDLKTSCVDETKADDATLVKEASPITDKAQKLSRRMILKQLKL
ncbi:unnamed protein product [Ambrosiozyma monospora]|uniref:Unnamed protein product n=1 Tax=Ambrosiozyma monospora TaxID=43982 RepID=A0ACB5TRJ5_AMBMO|nr:unnamed protein product [Ambrosiozyma monospora]